jgi:hypothetical protein
MAWLKTAARGVPLVNGGGSPIERMSHGTGPLGGALPCSLSASSSRGVARSGWSLDAASVGQARRQPVQERQSPSRRAMLPCFEERAPGAQMSIHLLQPVLPQRIWAQAAPLPCGAALSRTAPVGSAGLAWPACRAEALAPSPLLGLSSGYRPDDPSARLRSGRRPCFGEATSPVASCFVGLHCIL